MGGVRSDPPASVGERGSVREALFKLPFRLPSCRSHGLRSGMRMRPLGRAWRRAGGQSTLHRYPSEEALAVARRRLVGMPSATFHLAGADTIWLPNASQDFGYSLGVLHHIPDTWAAMSDRARKLKPGAPALVYFYDRFDNRPAGFRLVWSRSDAIRRVVSRLPFLLEKGSRPSLRRSSTRHWREARRCLRNWGPTSAASRSISTPTRARHDANRCAGPVRNAAGTPLHPRRDRSHGAERWAERRPLGRRRAILGRLRRKAPD